jgi:phage gp29-like protein
LQTGTFDRASYLYDAIMGDDRAGAVMSTRINGLLGSPLKFEPAADKRKSKAIAESLEEDYWDICPEAQIDSLISYGRGLGVALAELRWKRHNGRLVPELYTWHSSHLRYDEFRNIWYVYTRDGEVEIEPNMGKWILYRPYGHQLAGTRTLIRQLAIPWLAKTYAVQDWARHSEKLAGVIKAKTPPQPAEKERDDFVRDLANLGSSGIVGVPDGWDAELLEASGQSYEAFEKLVNWADTAMAIAVLGQNLSTEVSGGSLAAANAQELVRQDYKQADAEGLATLLHDGVLEYWCKLNYGDDSLTPWATYDTEPEADQKADADTLAVQAQAVAGLKTLNVGVDVRTMLEEMDIPLLKESEMLPPTPAPQPQPPPQIPPEVQDGEQPSEQPQAPPAQPPLQAAIRLASGDSLRGADGFVQGQLYTDSLGDEAGKRGAAALLPFVQTVLAVIGDARDYDDLRRKLRTTFADSNPVEFAGIMEKSLILANMAGGVAVMEDAPEVSSDVGG